MIPGYWLEGHALVSADERIAAADGSMPAELYNDADWARFQQALDESVLVVLGRLSHEARPNARRRRRMVVTSASWGIEHRADTWWWNPAGADIRDALAAAAPEGGRIAIPGGRAVFDLFLAIGFDGFDLARAPRVSLAGGVPVFSGIAEGRTAATLMRASGLALAGTEMLDPDADVVLESWRRMA